MTFRLGAEWTGLYCGIHYLCDMVTGQQQIDVLKETLIPGLPDFEWTIEYQRYINDPDNEELKAGVDLRLRSLLRTMLARPENHLG